MMIGLQSSAPEWIPPQPRSAPGSGSPSLDPYPSSHSPPTAAELMMYAPGQLMGLGGSSEDAMLKTFQQQQANEELGLFDLQRLHSELGNMMIDSDGELVVLGGYSSTGDEESSSCEGGDDLTSPVHRGSKLSPGSLLPPPGGFPRLDLPEDAEVFTSSAFSSACSSAFSSACSSACSSAATSASNSPHSSPRRLSPIHSDNDEDFSTPHDAAQPSTSRRKSRSHKSSRSRSSSSSKHRRSRSKKFTSKDVNPYTPFPTPTLTPSTSSASASTPSLASSSSNASASSCTSSASSSLAPTSITHGHNPELSVRDVMQLKELHNLARVSAYEDFEQKVVQWLQGRNAQDDVVDSQFESDTNHILRHLELH